MSDEEDASSLDPQKSNNNCKVCKSYIGKNVPKIQCKDCSIKVHAKYFDHISKVFVIESENWACKLCYLHVLSPNVV